ncbi:mRNA decapping complex subunit [Entophlyctis helioformis]|nr:mRNA decapping complex subunit [Entophlyctis helioformis]
MDSFLPGSASLVDCVDKRLLVTLRDGRHLFGWLRTYDQFANLVLHDTVERTFVNGTYGDVFRGIFLVRGENVVLLGEIDDDKESTLMQSLTEVPPADALRDVKAQQDAAKKLRDQRNKTLASIGFSVDMNEDDNY